MEHNTMYNTLRILNYIFIKIQRKKKMFSHRKFLNVVLGLKIHQIFLFLPFFWSCVLRRSFFSFQETSFEESSRGQFTFNFGKHSPHIWFVGFYFVLHSSHSFYKIIYVSIEGLRETNLKISIKISSFTIKVLFVCCFFFTLNCFMLVFYLTQDNNYMVPQIFFDSVVFCALIIFGLKTLQCIDSLYSSCLAHIYSPKTLHIDKFELI